MKRKIIGLCICMLMISTAIPIVTSLKINKINTTVTSGPLSNTETIWTQMQKLLVSDGLAGDRFGFSVALAGDTAIVGAEADDDNGNYSGSAYVFIRSGTTWTLQQKLLASDGAAGDDFGRSVAIDGNTVLIGAISYYSSPSKAGAAYVFTRTGTTWTQQQKLQASDGEVNDYFGFSVSISGDTALIGTPGDDALRGSAYVFTRSGTTWTQQQKLLADDGAASDVFGYSVSLSGDTALIGAVHDDSYKGSAYIYTRTGTTWTQQQKLTASDGAANDFFGLVALDGDTALIGAHGDDGYKGSTYVFIRTGTTWTQQAKLLTSDGTAGDNFGGFSVSLDGDTALIGAYLDDDLGTESGSAYVFTRTGTSWTQQAKLLTSDGEAGDWFGYSVALDGDTALIGAYNNDDNGIDSGSAYVFTKTGADLSFSITGGLGVKVEITNNGTSDANDVPWQIHVQGGILKLINKTVNGTIDIPAGDTITVTTGMIFGFGPISIVAKVADEEQTASGTQLIIFSMVK